MPLRTSLRTVLLLLPMLMSSACALWPFGRADDETGAAPARPTIKLEVAGVDGRLEENVRAHVSLASKPCDIPPAYLRGLAADAVDEARTALRAYGYYAATAAVETKTPVDACPRVLITVEPGERVHLRAVDVRVIGAAAQDAAFERALADLPLTTGDGLSHARYTAAKSRIETIALERGYLDGRFRTARLAVDPAHGHADVTLVFHSGPRYSLGELRIDQEPALLSDELVRRFLDHAPGEPYNAGTVTRYYSTLSGSGYFDAVEVRPLLSQPSDETIPFEVALTPRKRHRYTAGIGASTDEGIRGRLNYANRRVNRHGHRVNSELRASLIEQRLGGAYQIPREHPADEWLNFQAGVRRQDVGTFRTIENRIGANETKRRPWGWMETRFVDLNHQLFDIAGASRTATLLIPGLRWWRTTADDLLYPTRGWTLQFEVRGSTEALLSDVNFVRANLTARAARGLPAGFRLLSRVHAGTSWVDDIGALPPTERFFAGGDNSIRGWGFENLGPRDANGKVVGGQHLAVGSLELEKFFTERWGGAAFVDAGNAFGGIGSSTGVRIGVGAGIRWRSPVGPARIDFAHPLDDDTLVRLHLRIGPDL